MSLSRFGLALSFAYSLSFNALAINLSDLQEIKLTMPAALSEQLVTTDMLISGTTAAVATHASNKTIAGAVYLYEIDENWRLSAVINSEFSADNFAKSIILDKNHLVVGADTDDDSGVDSGAVYLFERAAEWLQWRQVAKIKAPDAQAGDRFGRGIALVDQTLYVGAPLRGKGKVYIFKQDEQSNWQFSESIESADPQAAHFGEAIAQEADTLIIGAPYTDADNSIIKQRRFAISRNDTFDPGVESGAIFVYKKAADQWQFVSRLGSTNRETADHLGEKIALQDDLIAASIKHKDVEDDLRAGTVYLYKYVAGEWLEDTALIADDSNMGANFGSGFTLLDKQVLVGANKIQANGFNSGQAYLFEQNSQQQWNLIHQQENTDLQPHDQFGLSVALGTDAMLVSSKDSVYAFQSEMIADYPAVFYPISNSLQLDAVNVEGIGVLSVALGFDGELFSLLHYHLQADQSVADSQFSFETGLLSIPRVAVQTAAGEWDFYRVELQQVLRDGELRFKIVSLASE